MTRCSAPSWPARDLPFKSYPPYVWIQYLDQDVDLRYLEGGFLGAQYAPMRVGIKEDNAASPTFRVRSFDPLESIGPERPHRRPRPEGNAPAAGTSV